MWIDWKAYRKKALIKKKDKRKHLWNKNKRERKKIKTDTSCAKEMHGIQHLFRQHAVEKQSSIDSWHSAKASFSNPSYSNGRISDSKPPVWNQGSLWKVFDIFFFAHKRILWTFLDRVLEDLHETKTMSSSPQPVPTMKSPSQENNSLGNSCSSSNRWTRSSPDPNKMMMGRSPNIIDVNAKRILSTTPSRRASHNVERVGSPSLSGYPVSWLYFKV